MNDLAPNPFEQLSFLVYELNLIVNKRWWRWLTCWFGGSTGVLVSYRLDRFFYLLLGNSWVVIRPVFIPLFLILRLIGSNHEIHYRAEIGKGLKILHPTLGIVISGRSKVGEHLTLTGGNCIGGRPGTEKGNLLVGNNVSLGANAIILGPICIGDNVTIGAGAVVVKDVENNLTVIGVPARPVNQN
jgi:serine acetyltransferase